MFLKRCVRKKRGKTHTYWALVESVRTAAGPRHRTVAFLGELRAAEREGWAELGRRLDGIPDELVQGTLFTREDAREETIPEKVEVRLRGVQVERSRTFGDVWLALLVWKALTLDRIFEDALPAGREDVPWATSAFILAAGRLCAPGSEFETAQGWYPKTALPELLGVAPDAVNPNRLYRTLDAILPHQKTVERRLAARLSELFDVKFDLLLYDITSTFFEGAATQNDLAARGYSRDSRPDCKQVLVALIVARDGMPLAHRVFAGNRADVTTVEEMVEEVEREFGKADRIWVMDRGMVSEDNLEFLRERGARYVVGTPKSMLRRFERDLVSDGWKQVESGIEVKVCPAPDGTETFLLCRSSDRREKERAMHDRFSTHIRRALAKIAKRLRTAKSRIQAGRIERQIGRLLAKNSRGAALFDIHVEKANGRQSGLRLRWRKDRKFAEWAMLSEGAYLLRTNLEGRDPEDLWRTYIQLTEVEDAFRKVKTDLAIRPIWHHLEDRVRAHIFVAFLGYVLWKTLQKWMERAGIGASVAVLLNEIRTLDLADVVLPTSAGRAVKLRCITTADPALRALLQRLGIQPPARLGIPSWIEKEAVA